MANDADERRFADSLSCWRVALSFDDNRVFVYHPILAIVVTVTAGHNPYSIRDALNRVYSKTVS